MSALRRKSFRSLGLSFVAVLLGLVVVAVLYAFVSTESPPVAVQTIVPGKSTARAAKTTPGAAMAGFSAADTAAEPLSPACRSYLESVRSFDAAAFASGSEATPVPLASPGCADQPKSLDQLRNSYLEACGRYAKVRDGSALAREKARKDCALAHTFYRSAITDFLTDKQPLATITDRRTLEDKTIARFSRDAESAAQAAERLLEVDPNNAAAAEVAASTRLVAAMNANRNRPLDEATASRVREAIERARRLEAGDPGMLTELEYGLESARKPGADELRRRAEEIVAKQPESGLGHYLRGCAARQAGNEAEAMRNFRRAVQVEPHSPRYREVVTLAETTPTGRVVDVCGMRMGLPNELLAPRAAR